GRRIHTVLQLRLHPALLALRRRLHDESPPRKHDVLLTYVTSRGGWYLVSWKGQKDRSGGLATNIGIHFFDLLLWLFRPVVGSEVHVANERRTGGLLELERARVRWFLSIERADLPARCLATGQPTYRSLLIDEQEVEFSEGFTELHTEVYRQILAG